MTDNTEAQPEALRLAASITASGQFTPLLTLDSAAAELRRQHAEIEQLKDLNARLQPTIEDDSQNWAKCDPAIAFHLIERHADNWADAGKMMTEFADAKAEVKLEALREELTTETNRAAAAEQQVTALTQRLDMANRLNTDARNELALANDAAAKGDLARANAGGMELRIAELEAENAAIVLTIKRSGLELLKTAKGFELTKQFKAEAQLSARQAAPNALEMPEPDFYVRPSIAAFELPWGVCMQENSGSKGAYLADTVRAALSAAPPPPEREPQKHDKNRELAETAMRFVDRAGDVHPGIDDADRICAEFHAAMAAVVDKWHPMPLPTKRQSPQHEPSSLKAGLERFWKSVEDGSVFDVSPELSKQLDRILDADPNIADGIGKNRRGATNDNP